MDERSSPLTDPITGYGLLAGFSVFFLVDGRDLAFGSVNQMGPGFFPTVLSALLLAMALGGIAVEVAARWRKRGLAARTAPRGEDEIWAIQWKPLIHVAVAIAAFALTVRSFGIVPAAVLSAFIAGLASGATPLRHLALLGLTIGAFVYAVFCVGLDLAVVPYRWPF